MVHGARNLLTPTKTLWHWPGCCSEPNTHSGNAAVGYKSGPPPTKQKKFVPRDDGWRAQTNSIDARIKTVVASARVLWRRRRPWLWHFTLRASPLVDQVSGVLLRPRQHRTQPANTTSSRASCCLHTHHEASALTLTGGCAAHHLKFTCVHISHSPRKNRLLHSILRIQLYS